MHFFIVGQYLVEQINSRDDLELAFVWNRTISVLEGKVEKQYILENLDTFSER